MGAEAKTILRLGVERHAVTALLESDELVVRGAHRLRITLGELRDARVEGDLLRLEHPGGVAELELGAKTAESWLKKIRNPRTLADKLGVKPGMRIAMLGFGDAAPVREDIAARGATVVEGEVPRGTAMVLLRITTPAALDALPAMAGRIARDGAIWVVHPRGDKAVADTVIFAAGKAAGLVATKVARFSEVDSAEKLVIPVAAR